jgi:hypothetical protein
MKKIIILFVSILIYAHPINLTKMIWDLNKSELSMRFVSFNLEKPLLLKNTPTAEEIKNMNSVIFDLILKHFSIISNNSKCDISPLKLIVKNEIIIDTFYKIKCKNLNELTIKFNLFFKEDPTQSGVLNIKKDKNETVLIFKPSQEIQKITLNTQTLSFKDFIIEGIWHIWLGFDHLTFLLMLIIPTIMFNYSIKTGLIDILKVVTAFTISHSITLSLSVFNIINPPERIIEILIAFSIFLTALNNLYPKIKHKNEWLLAFLFGFIHGFGFANALKELDLENVNFAKLVFGFNLGVEIGQVVIVSLILPLLYIIIKKHPFVYRFLSVLGALLALLWMIDRVSGLNFMPI